jgi:hypothetical protein
MRSSKTANNDKELAKLLLADEKVMKEIQTSSNNSIGKTLLKAYASELKQLIKAELRTYYSSYSPNVYVRNKSYESLLNSMVVGSLSVVSDTRDMSISITFDDRAYGESLFEPKHSSFKAALINEGWQVKSSVSWSRIEHFGYYNGYHFIEKGIQKFKKKHPEVKVTLTKSLSGGSEILSY